jgi:hypothetical protein
VVKDTKGFAPKGQGREVKIQVVHRQARHLPPVGADTVTLKFGPKGRLDKAELCNGTEVVETVPGAGLRSLEAVGGRMRVQVDGPGGRREGPFEADWVRMGYPPGSQAAIGSTLPSGESRWHVVQVLNGDVAVWTCRVEEH